MFFSILSQIMLSAKADLRAVKWFAGIGAEASKPIGNRADCCGSARSRRDRSPFPPRNSARLPGIRAKAPAGDSGLNP
jgi:hypothetical protein